LRYVDAPALVKGHDAPLDNDTGGKPCPSPILSADIAEVASEVAAALESSMGIPFAKAYSQVRDQNCHMKLLALISAMLNLASEKGLAGSSGVSVVFKREPGRQFHGALIATSADSASERRAG
jgi:hypothetical protein